MRYAMVWEGTVHHKPFNNNVNGTKINVVYDDLQMQLQMNGWSADDGNRKAGDNPIYIHDGRSQCRGSIIVPFRMIVSGTLM